jgi:hypothetical protein
MLSKSYGIALVILDAALPTYISKNLEKKMPRIRIELPQS